MINKLVTEKKRILFCLFCICIILGCFFIESIMQDDDKETPQSMSVLLDSGIYLTDQKIVVDVPQKAVVYYTNDCTEPNETNGILYEKPIVLTVTDETVLHTYRFKAYYQNGDESAVETYTYFVGEDADKRYTTNVLHVVGEPEDLFGYEEGIFAFGRKFDEYMEANPGAHLGGGIDANFQRKGRETEKEVVVEFFQSDGSSFLKQNCGIRVYGDTSRLKNQKSFKLYARQEYDELDDFNYPFLKDFVSYDDGTVAQKYEQLIVRSGGTDNGYGYIRSELCAKLASLAGYEDAMYAEPICVYMNGEYRGIYWLCNAYDDCYFEEKYGEHNGQFVVLGGVDDRKEDDPEVQEYVDEYNNFYVTFANADLTDDSTAAALNEVLDIENYLQYFAIQNYIGNWDSIDNNLKAYRYVSEDFEYEENTVYDGRYRHLLFDLDFGYGLKVQFGGMGVNAGDRTLQRFLDASPLFKALMQRQDCREYFINYTCELMNGAMSYESVATVLPPMHGEREAELRYMLENSDVQKDSICKDWEGDCIEKYETVENNYAIILKFAEERPKGVLIDLVETFSLSYYDIYKLNLENTSNASEVYINSEYCVSDFYEGNYFLNIPLSLTCEINDNEEFVCWEINGEVYKEQNLVIDESKVIDGEVNIKFITKEVEEPVLQLNAIKAKGSEDYVEIINNSNKAISTSLYYLSDSDDVYRYALPIKVLKPGESFRVWGKDSKSIESLGQYVMNFNLKQGETLTLSYKGEVLETLEVPKMTEDGIYKKIIGRKKFVEVLGE